MFGDDTLKLPDGSGEPVTTEHPNQAATRTALRKPAKVHAKALGNIPIVNERKEDR